jgi:hypothetical protein
VRQILSSCLALALFAVPRPAASQTPSNPETLIRLSVTAAPAPRPALRYRLLPDLQEMNPGNPILNYMKCMLEQERFFFDREACAHREKLLAMPLEELPAHDLEGYGRFALSQADRAARLDNPDWQILLKLKSDGYYLLLPEVQQIRGIARALVVRFRAEIAMHRFDDAIRTAKTLFAISRHLGEHPSFIGNLVGIAIANMTIGPLEEMLGQSGCPNLYWALTSLPNPMISLEKGMDGERVMTAWAFRDLPDGAPIGADQLKKFIAHADKILELEMSKDRKASVRAWLYARIKDEKQVAAARRRLVEIGLPEERLRKFPPDQILLLDEKRECEERFADLWKATALPLWQIEAVAAQIKPKKEPALFADLLLPMPFVIHRARGRLDQRIALLRVVEAIRLYAAGHNDTLPPKLSDIPVPIPEDPFTGKSFRYDVNGGTAHLRGSPPSGEEKNVHYNIHYEINVQKSHAE